MKRIDPVELVREYGGVTAAAKALGVSRTAIYKWISAKQIPRRSEAYIYLVKRDDK